MIRSKIEFDMVLLKDIVACAHGLVIVDIVRACVTCEQDPESGVFRSHLTVCVEN